MEAEELVDTQLISENVSFLDNCFDNSFVLQSSRITVQEYIAEEKSFYQVNSQESKKRKSLSEKSIVNSTLIATSKIESLTQCKVEDLSAKRKLRNWGLPHQIVQKYEDKGIKEMFDWQVTCLSNPKVLLECSNLVYSAPTSAGKTLVAEILTIKTVLERQKKVVVILPFVSIVREKMYYLQDILSSSGVRVEGFVGSQSPPGGLQAVHVAICTIEKANGLVNRLLDDGNISELGAVIVDELHLLGDPHRGYILELLLTKIKYVSNKQDNTIIQIVGMSATLPNLEVLADWLQAELFVTHFRPIPLDEYCLVGNQYYNEQGQCANIENQFNVEAIDNDSVLKICLSTIKEGCSVLIFCMTKNRCETLAQSVANSFYQIGCSGKDVGSLLRQQLNSDNIAEVLEQLKNCPVGLDSILKNTISFGVAYHHAGLTFDERDIIEGGFKSGALRVLVATSTLSSGVNLPARTVIVRTPVFQRKPINILTYKQMIGRAGRMGQDLKGESILMCTEAEKNIGLDLMLGKLDPVHSCIESEDKFMRAILEMIASQELCTQSDLEIYSKCTLLFAQQSDVNAFNDLLGSTLNNLISCELVRQQKEDDEVQYVATSLGKACLSSSMAPHDGISLFCELQKARQCLVLETDLHLIYLVTPYSVSSQWGDIDWLHLLTLWESLTRAMKKVGELVGVQESFIVRSLRGATKFNVNANKLNIHKRFYTALALQDLVNEVPLAEVATKFQCARGFLQSLQQAAATFAGMVTAFCRQLGWKNMEMLISQFQDRLHFGIHSELIDLMKLPTLNGKRARTLYDLGFETIFSIASSDVNSIENALLKTVPFQSEKEREDDDNDDVRKRNKIKNIWITGCCGITTKEAAQNLIMEARKYLEYEIGATEIKWNNNVEDNADTTKLKISSSQEHVSDINRTTNNIAQEEKVSNIESSYHGQTTVASLTLQEKKQTADTKNIIIETTSPLTNKLCTSHSIHSTLQVKHELDYLKSNIEWDTLNFTEGVIENISKGRMSDNIFSPDISLSDLKTKDVCTEPETTTAAKLTTHDSLFSSEEDSIFDESLPMDLISSKLLQGNDGETVCTVTKEPAVPTADKIEDLGSISDAFKSTLITFTDDEDEDIKLVYDDENNLSENEFETGFNLSQDMIEYPHEIISSSWKMSCKSPRKREAETNHDQLPSAKKSRQSKQVLPKANNKLVDLLDVKSIDIVIKNHSFKCFVFKDRDILKNMNLIMNVKEAVLSVKINISAPDAQIGKNIVTKCKLADTVVAGNREQLSSICLCIDDSTCLVLDIKSITGDDKEKVIRNLAILLSDNEAQFKVLSLKSTLNRLRKLGLEIRNCDDISLNEWLIDSNERVSTIFYLIKKHSNIDLTGTPIKVDTRIKKFSTLEELESLCVSAWSLRYIANQQRNILAHQFKNYEDVLKIELQVLRILLDSEYEGITVDKELLSQLLVEVKNALETLQKKAYTLCGYHFNLNSSQDVAKVLGMYKGRKVSTKKCVLEALNNPMANVIMYWRKLNSILTKTLYPLTEKAFIHSQGNRIYPSYAMFTCTGRVSMHEPNLQNVPRAFVVEGSLAVNVRAAVLAAPGCVLVAADYCQLELRLLAHYSGDAALAATLAQGGDVFTTIAAAWTGLQPDQVDEATRDKTKQLCYGLVYGMGARAAARRLALDEAAAARLQRALAAACPAPRDAAAALAQRARRVGHADTLLRRRRYLPGIRSPVLAERQAAERRGVNSAVQGSAADVAALALTALLPRCAALRPRLLLHLHDELLFELPAQHRDAFARLLVRAMEHAVRLTVPLPVKVKSGYSWGTMTPLSL